MSLLKFLDTIKFLSFEKSDEKRRKIILDTNPQRIFPENVRSYFNTSLGIADFLCKMAVKDGVFEKKIGIVCPNENCERIIKSYSNENIDEELNCNHCELIGNERFVFNARDLKKIEFYQLVKG